MKYLHYNMFLLVLIQTILLLTCLVEVSAWPNLFSSSSSSSSNNDEKKMTNKKKSIITSRDLEASIAAHTWPTTLHSPFCEAWSFLDTTPRGDHELKWLYLDALARKSRDHPLLATTKKKDDEEEGVAMTYSDSLSLAVETAVEAYNVHRRDGNDDDLESSSASSSSYSASDISIQETFDVRLLQYALALRAQSPTCELHRTLAREAALTSGLYVPNTTKTTTATTNYDDDDEYGWNINAFAVLYPWGKVSTDVEEIIHLYQSKERETKTTTKTITTTTTTTMTNENDKTHSLPGEVTRLGHANPDKYIILYGNFGTEAFHEFYDKLVDTSSDHRMDGIELMVRYMGDITYEEQLHQVSRRQAGDKVGKDFISKKTVLQGYGVRLDIRNVEYRAFDDKGLISDEDGMNMDDFYETIQSNMTLQDEFLGGINLARLVSRAAATAVDDGEKKRERQDEKKLAEIQTKLLQYHQVQNKVGQVIPPRWQRRKLALQATAAISSGADPLLTLQDVSQNLPTLASTLISVDVPSDIIEAATTIKKHVGGTKYAPRNGEGGTFAFYVNGRRIWVDRPSFNVFELLSILREEDSQLKHMCRKLGRYLNTGALRVVQSALTMGESGLKSHGRRLRKRGASNDERDDDDDDDENRAGEEGGSGSSSSKKYRIDVGRGWKGAVIYCNDIEKDSRYRSWPRQVQNVLFAMQFGAPPSVRRNLFTVLLVVDPLSGLDNPALLMASELLNSGYPLRVGILLINNDDIAECKRRAEAGEIMDGEECHVSSIFHEASTPSSLEEMKDVKATAQAAHKLFSHVVSTYDGLTGLSYLNLVLDEIQERKQTSGSELTMLDLINIHASYMAAAELLSSEEATIEAMRVLTQIESADSSYKSESSVESSYGRAVHFAMTRALKSGMSFLNGLPLPTASDGDENVNVGEEMSKILSEEHRHLLQLIMTRKITDSSPKSVYGMLLSGDAVFKRHHPLLMKSDGGGKSFLSLTYSFDDETLLFPKSIGTSNVVQATDPKGDDAAAYLVEAVVELDTEDGLAFLSSLLTTANSFPSSIGSGDDTDNVSVALRIIPSSRSSAESPLASIFRRAGKFDISTLLALTVMTMRSGTVDEDGSMMRHFIANMHGLSVDVRNALFDAITEESTPAEPYLEQDLPAANFLLANGRVYVPDEMSVAKEDLELLLTMEMIRAKALTRLLRPHYLTEEGRGFHNAVGRSATFLGKQFSSSKSASRTDIESELISLEKSDIKNPLHFVWNENDGERKDRLQVKVTVVLDPLTEGAQRAAPLLRAIRDQLKLPLSLILAPRTDISGDDTIPISSYYRFVADPLALPDSNPPKASFTNLPTNHVLTIRMDVPEPWNVQQTYSVQDTDNLRCDIHSGCGDEAYMEQGTTDEVPDGDDEEQGKSFGYEKRNDLTQVEYGLSSLLFFGQCYDVSKSTPPNGLQLTLTKKSEEGLTLHTGNEDVAEMEILPDGSLNSSPLSPLAATAAAAAAVTAATSTREGGHYSDTLVMKTVGYWQLRAQPGVWTLNIAPKSRGSEIYDMVEGTVVNGKVRVASNSTNAATKTLVMKDFLNYGELLLVKRKPGYEQASLFYNEGEKEKTNGDDQKIHVFSLATGHLYERFLKIMLLSVTKRTSLPVKFWLFENFLSPSFKETAIDMAKRIGCEVEFVTYKWPEWLRGQSEKQRIIWGYKILFLDVLFPLDVKKIIYVDADQVVRGDLKELWDYDLQGAPYGYTPFCDSREATLGYQFWRSGFWETHLRGKPYHISALYVVDLERFRRELVGDKLRHTYQQLSADPNSLANLDQDLPNYAQHTVRIHSLPQEWLWCETWCSDETKATAKTIDLCNNPMHKEPKIAMAKRIISGELFNESWVELDEEVRRYEDEYRKSLLTAQEMDNTMGQ